MKLFKKVGAVFLALAMIAVMIPQIGNKVVKAAEPSGTDTWNANDYVVNGKEQTVTFNGSYIKGTGVTVTTSQKAKGYSAGAKIGSTPKFTVTVPTGKFAKITVWSLSNGSMETQFSVGTQIITQNKASGADVEALEHIIPGSFSEGTYEIKKKNKEAVIFKIQVDMYDRVDDVPADKVETKVTVSGTITSDVSLEGGTIRFLGDKTANGELKLKSGTTNQYEYSIAGVVGDNATYYIEVESQALIEGKVLLRSDLLKKQTFIVGTENITNKDFTLEYEPIENAWDFTSENWQMSSYEGKTGTYKGLEIDATAKSTNPKYTAKFAVASGYVQINEGTIVTIPVSGWGTVTCEFSGALTENTKLGEKAGDGKTTISYDYKNAESVKLSIGTDNGNLQLKKITVKPDATPAVALCGAAVRQETEGWGNGIRFGAQLDLTKVDKDTCESGTLIGLESIVGEGKEMTIDDVDKTCRAVVRTTFIKEENNKLEYAAALINIPDGTNGTDNALDTKIVARSYVKVGDNVYYGEQIPATYNEVAAAVSAVQ